MNPGPISRDISRKIDDVAINEFGIPGIVLMENAGRQAAELLIQLGIHGPVTIACGKGNNGGDGFVIARHLNSLGFPVEALVFSQPDSIHGDAKTNYQILTKMDLTPLFFPSPLDFERITDLFQRSTWIIDALLGTGLTGETRSPYRELIDLINSTSCPVLSIDLPSGLDCDQGIALGTAVHATHTATLVAPKKGFSHPGASIFTGHIHTLDIGIPRKLIASLVH